MKCKFLILLTTFALLAGVALQAQPKREMRGVWVATVAAIDFPSKPGIPVAQQKQEIIDMLERQQELKMNTIIFQVRPSSDAFYQSPHEPWSQWLTGEQGKKPEPAYDPLRFFIEEAHKRGMELHAWLNPYRALTNLSNAPDADSVHISKKHPGWLIDYGNKRYMDPGLPQVQAYLTMLVRDIITRYEVDAIHMDDYFYPYRIEGKAFPDTASFRKHGGDFTREEKDDWRRQNVNRVIRMIHDTIEAYNPRVQFGISPFAVWRNKHQDPEGSATQAGQTNYDDLFADVLHWIDEGWLDYVAPQLYFHIGFEVADFKVLLKWWSQKAREVNLYIGQGIYRLGKSDYREWKRRRFFFEQIELIRQSDVADGSIFFSERVFKDNPRRAANVIARRYYDEHALVPEIPDMKKLEKKAPVSLWLKETPDGDYLEWTGYDTNKFYVVYRFRGDKIGELSDPENIYKITDKPGIPAAQRWHLFKRTYTYMVTGLNCGNYETRPSNAITVKIR